MKEAEYYIKLENQRVQCTLCPHHCRLDAEEIGRCSVRQNRNGILYSLVYERAAALHVDPIEKKPLFHLYPGSRSFSLATVGCNFSCHFCQNHTLSQVNAHQSIPGRILSAADIVRLALDEKCKTIACTYTEPTVYYEYAYEIARLAAEKEIQTVLVTNGFINPAPLKKIAPFITGANVDLKGWNEDFYRQVCGGELKPVLQTLRRMKKSGIWVEVTTLMVTGLVDNEVQLREIAHFIRHELGPETPWHISRFYPHYRLFSAPTPAEKLARARAIGLDEGLQYVYCGNLAGDAGENTYCPSCGKLLIHRYGFSIVSNIIRESRCPACHTEIAGQGMNPVN